MSYQYNLTYEKLSLNAPQTTLKEFSTQMNVDHPQKVFAYILLLNQKKCFVRSKKRNKEGKKPIVFFPNLVSTIFLVTIGFPI